MSKSRAALPVGTHVSSGLARCSAESHQVADARRIGAKPSWVRFAVVRRSRRDRRCDSCGESIPKGSLYVRHALPPNTEPIYSDRWAVLVACGWTTGDCRRYWVIDSKDLNGEPHVIPA